MSAIRRKLTIEQGATGPFPNFFTYHNPRTVFNVVVPDTDRENGLSGVIEPVWPDTGCDCDQIVDNEVTWACNRQATDNDWRTLKRWCASTLYTFNNEIITAKVPIDITGYAARMQFRDGPADDAATTVLFEMTDVADVDGNVIELGGTAGTIEIIIQADTTETFDWDESEYDLELIAPASAKYPNGFVKRLLEGVVVVSQERTRT